MRNTNSRYSPPRACTGFTRPVAAVVARGPDAWLARASLLLAAFLQRNRDISEGNSLAGGRRQISSSLVRFCSQLHSARPVRSTAMQCPRSRLLSPASRAGPVVGSTSAGGRRSWTHLRPSALSPRNCGPSPKGGALYPPHKGGSFPQGGCLGHNVVRFFRQHRVFFGVLHHHPTLGGGLGPEGLRWTFGGPDGTHERQGATLGLLVIGM